MKIPSYLQGFTGRIGDYTIYECNGRTVIRSRHNSRPSAGHSPAQLLQRARWSNSVNLWRRFPEGERPRYEDLRTGQNNMNRFASECLHSDPVYFTRRQGLDGACVIVPVCVSQGPLEGIAVAEDGEGRIRSSLAADGLAGEDCPTVARLARAIVDGNQRFEWGDGIGFYHVEQRWDKGNDIPTVRVRYNLLMLDPADCRLVPEAVGGSPGFALRDGYLAFEGDLFGGLAWLHLRKRRLSYQRLYCRNPYIEQFGSEAARHAAVESFAK